MLCLTVILIYISFFLPKLGKFSASISRNEFSSVFLFAFFFWEPYKVNVSILDVVLWGFWTILIFKSVFFLLDFVISTTLTFRPIDPPIPLYQLTYCWFLLCIFKFQLLYFSAWFGSLFLLFKMLTVFIKSLLSLVSIFMILAWTLYWVDCLSPLCLVILVFFSEVVYPLFEHISFLSSLCPVLWAHLCIRKVSHISWYWRWSYVGDDL